MRYASYEYDGRRRVGQIDDSSLIPLNGLVEIGADTPLGLLTATERLSAERVPVSDVHLLPVTPNPSKVVCVGLNYADHIAETGRDTPTYPVLFTKFGASLIGPTDDIVLPPETSQMDWEGELVVVIGKSGRRIPVEQAPDYVAGYTVANDITMRDYQYKTHQWLQGKAWDRSTPIGPYLVTPDEVDLTSAGIRTILNGAEVQNSVLSQLFFDVPTLIATISEFTVLQPGDLILTGTPGGVGYRRKPQLFLSVGDTVTVEIDGVGSITNHITEDPSIGGTQPSPD